MFDLKCKRMDCQYNKNCNCNAKIVNVTKNTYCGTYEKSNEAEVGEIEKIGRPPIRKNVKVECEANCIFNENEICTANGITVLTCKNKSCPICCTFLEE